jgi:NTP pyrophosphatase (non-canonical NTP hydrolase)
MTNVALEYYEKKFGDDVTKAFVHLVREIGEIALAIERSNNELAKMEITESAALLQFMARKYGFDLQSNIDSVYTKKLQTLNK